MKSSRLARNGFSVRGGSSLNLSSQSMLATRPVSSSSGMPAAYTPPTSAPMLVPAMHDTGMRISSSTFSTPRCATPRAPPPPSTTPTRGLRSWAKEAKDCRARQQASATAARRVI